MLQGSRGMNRWLLLATLLFCLPSPALAQAPRTPSDDGFLSFSEDRSMELIRTTVTFQGTGLRSTVGNPERVWFARRDQIRGSTNAVSHLDSRRCPIALQVLSSAQSVAAPEIELPPLRTDREDEGYGNIILDVPEYSLTSRALYSRGRLPGRITISGDGRTPVGAWVRVALAALEPCWTNKEPAQR